MSAADYYNPAQAPGPSFPQPANNNRLNPNPPYPLSDAPPPYREYPEPPRPHSQPPPQHRPPPQDQYWHPPPPPNGPPPTNGQQAPEKSSRPVPQFKTSDFTGPGTYAPQNGQQHRQYQQPQGYFPLAGSPAMQQVCGNGGADMNGRRPSTTPGYRPSASPYRDDYYRGASRLRSRSRSRSRHRRHHHDRQPAQRKKSSGVNTFLGAGGGAILGDAIFPGLGTGLGAILGGLGGHEYSKKKKSHSNPPSKMRDRSYSNDGDYYEDYRRGRKY